MLTDGKHFPEGERFSFDAEVTSVFDDMAERSIPGYRHAHDAMASIIHDTEFEDGDQVWDFGCSTGNALKVIREAVDNPLVNYVGCDISRPMIDEAAKRHPWAEFLEIDLNDGVPASMTHPKVVVLGWCLQFITDIPTRLDLLRQIRDVMDAGSMLFIFEKWDMPCNRLQHDYLYWRRFTKGYSPGEIIAKNRALDQIMTPWSKADLIRGLMNVGFTRGSVHDIYQIFNFGGVVATL